MEKTLETSCCNLIHRYCISGKRIVISYSLGKRLIGYKPISLSARLKPQILRNWGQEFNVTLDLKISGLLPAGQILQFSSNKESFMEQCNEIEGQGVPELWILTDRKKRFLTTIYYNTFSYSFAYNFQLNTWYNIMLSKKKERVRFQVTYCLPL